MGELWSAVAELAVVLSPERIDAAAAMIERIGDSADILSQRHVFGPNLDSERWKRFAQLWVQTTTVTPGEVASALRASARMSELLSGGQAVDLVWTGPRSEFVPIRSTEQVMLELIGRATGSIFLVTFVNYGAQSVVRALNEACSRGVGVRMLLEGSKDTARKLAATVPAADVFYWPEEAKPSASSPVSMHAKCVVADRAEALITSANLTDHALDLNMELGVHIRGGREPAQLHDHLNALAATNKIQRFEPAQ